jgi:quercetin dioxygenase-like cupin family protein
MAGRRTTRIPRSAAPDAHIGPVLKRLRLRAGMSLRTLASRAEFSASFISLLEKGQVSPSIASLERIAHTLGVTLVDLFREAHAPAEVVVRVASRPAFTSTWSRARIESLTSGGEGVEALAVTLAPTGTSGAHPTEHTRDQFAYQLKGALTLLLGEERIGLKTGDAVTIPSGTAHRWQNDSRRLAQVLLVFCGRPG